MRHILYLCLAAGLTALFSLPAYAHPGHGAPDALGGFAHPFTGLDHIMTAVGAGAWAALLGRRAKFRIPLAFVLGLLGGCTLAWMGVSLPMVESGILASVLAAGLAIWTWARPALWVGTAGVAFFAIFHGYAHGSEMPANVGGFLYAAGLCIASGLLLGAGLLMGQLLIAMGRPRWRRALGGAIVATCALMAVGVV